MTNDAELEQDTVFCLCIKRKQKQLRLEKEKKDKQGKHTWVQKVVSSDAFMPVMICLICLNAVFLAVQTDVSPNHSTTMTGREINLFWGINLVFVAIFALEITLRIAADGCIGFFIDENNWAWNVFDFTIVAACFIVQILLHVVPGDTATRRRHKHHASAMENVSRSLLVFRVLRVVRVFRAFRKLGMLAQGLLESVQAVFWIGVLTYLMVFLCAILCTTLIGQNADAFGDNREEIREMWGTVNKSAFTLFQILTMDGWGDVYHEVTEKMPFMTLFFFPFVFIGAFVIMSLLTGVMADHMNEVRVSTEDEERMEKMSNLVQIVRDADKDGDGKLDLMEFTEALGGKKEEIHKALKGLNVTVSRFDAMELFEWFDTNNDQRISTEELQLGCKNLVLGLTAFQRYRLCVTINAAADFVKEALADSKKPPPWASKFGDPGGDADRKVSQLEANMVQAENRIASFEAAIHKMMGRCGWAPGAEDDEAAAATCAST